MRTATPTWHRVASDDAREHEEMCVFISHHCIIQGLRGHQGPKGSHACSTASVKDVQAQAPQEVAVTGGRWFANSYMRSGAA
jgi:hypothetical protein